ncbi:PepSY-associated TM helix domain-containing protein [Sinomicrobium soli]|uniref:PepSY-associated TM helix domain-containing protein n=1 Tax=Sinomicrobium sp. N-1-3-6 TaxID=2219864 RepID=UPI000DCBA7BA|nr:PepSY-associated TM helix domain-containing protein [Sinomicrobium sp. N-1-3-6]RAV30325.1 hypothetical protein DN748_02090 [Sinomicrobium sp. N-1-3-6]
MKLNSLKPRLHNVMFHTHTVAGIVISFALYVIFFTGAVALFMGELYRWENPEARFESVDPDQVDYNKIYNHVKAEVQDFDTALQFGIVPPSQEYPFAYFYGTTKDANGKTERFSTNIDPRTYKVTPFKEPKTHMAQTLYELHFFHQIPLVGLYLSGLVSFFFIFVIITGLLTHWKNIINKFYAFTTKGKWKQIWTNSHISLGFITLPFQIIYAVTGALLGLSILLLAPSSFLIFDGNTTEVYKAVKPAAGFKYDRNAGNSENGIGLNAIYHKARTSYPDTKVTYLSATNFGKEDGTITVNLDDHTGISGDGTIVYSHRDGSLLKAIEPQRKSYTEGAFGVMIKLHFANFGGILLKIIYFILSMITCYIIISGVMIWRTARDNNRYTNRQRRFHHRVTKVYLAICLSMFPATALIFLANKLVPMDVAGRVAYVNAVFFLGWLGLTLLGLFWNDYRKLNRNYLFLGSILGLMVPLANGFVTGDWFWKTWIDQQYYVFSVDVTWIVIGVFGSLIWRFDLKGKNGATGSMHKEKKGDKNTFSGTVLPEYPEPALESRPKK